MFVEQFCRRDGLSPKQIHPAAESELMSRPWPGNIRELENAVEMAVIRSQDRSVIEIDDFPASCEAIQPACAPPETGLPAEASYKEIIGRFERELIRQVLDRTAGNKTQAADVLQLKRTTLVEKIQKTRPGRPGRFRGLAVRAMADSTGSAAHGQRHCV